MPADYTLKPQLKPLLCLNFPQIFSSLVRASTVNLINAETLKIGRVYLLSVNLINAEKLKIGRVYLLSVNLINAETLKIGRVYLLSYNHSTQGYGLSNV
jgi:hypothetical protein